MSYIKRVLRPGETIVYRGRLHWIIYAPAILAFIVAIVIAGFALRFPDYSGEIYIAAGTVAVAGLVLAFRGWFDQWITQIAVTNLRVIYKRGFIRRYTAEMNMDKVESVTVDQSILGRILGYGTIQIRGVGVGIEQLRRITSPIDFRNAIVSR